MVNIVREICSRDKRRYKEDGFNLDLTYILPKVIAMGYPADYFEAMYRNPIQEVVRLLNTKHPATYKIYNLCEERRYDPFKFENRVATYPFRDHHPPPLDSMLKFCKDIDDWSRTSEEHVAAVHCKAGKGRTGVMICAYLLYSEICSTPEEALNFYAEKRTKNTNGVTIPSQRRYVHYFSQILRYHLQYRNTQMMLRSVRFEGSFLIAPCHIGFRVYVNNEEIFKSATYELQPTDTNVLMNAPDCGRGLVQGDVRIDFYIRRKLEFLQQELPRHKKKRSLRVCFNTFMLCQSCHHSSTNVKQPNIHVHHKYNHTVDDSTNDCNAATPSDLHTTLCDVNDATTSATSERSLTGCHVLSLNKDEVDIVSKKKSSKYFPNDFRMIILFECFESNHKNEADPCKEILTTLSSSVLLTTTPTSTRRLVMSENVVTRKQSTDSTPVVVHQSECVACSSVTASSDDVEDAESEMLDTGHSSGDEQQLDKRHRASLGGVSSLTTAEVGGAKAAARCRTSCGRSISQGHSPTMTTVVAKQRQLTTLL